MAVSSNVAAAYREAGNFVAAVAAARTDTGAYQYSSQDVVSAVHSVAASYGSRLSQAASRGLFGLISQVRSNAAASEALTSAPAGASIDSSMIGQWYTAAGPAVQAAQPEYFARAQISYTNAVGEQVTTWFQVKGITQLPATADALALRLTGLAISAYTKPVSEGGKYEPAQQMTGLPEITQIQLYAV